ncbi:MAG: type VI secretion system tip protein VgrG [Pseudomonadota bacterium]
MNSPLPLTQAPDVVNLVIAVDGQELPGTINLLSVEVVHQINRIPYARLRIADGDPAIGDFALSSGDLFVPGGELTIQAGYHGDADDLFSGIVLKQRVVVRNSDAWLEVECRDKAFQMTLARHNRYFNDKKDSDVVHTLLDEYSIDGDVAPTGVEHSQLLQFQTSDWDFLVSRLEANGQVAALRGGALTTFKPTLDANAIADISYGVTLLELDAEFDARSQCGTLQTYAWDVANQSLLSVDAAEPEWTTNGNLDTAAMTAATGFEESGMWHGGAVSSDALQSWADGALLRARMAASQGRVRFQGLAAMAPGGVLQLSRVSDRYNGLVFISGVRHEFTRNDWTTDVEFGLSRTTHLERFDVDAKAAAGLLPGVRGLHIGVVTQLADDPASEFRICVKVPLAGMDEQGIWARVATLDAGAGAGGVKRGTFFRPETDDEVVLGFLHDDPSQPVVLGMLHSSAIPPPLDPTADNHQKTYMSRSGIQLLFDDDKKIVSLTTPGGNVLTLDDDAGGITLEDQNGNSIKMTSDGIKLESAKAIEFKAQTDIKAQGTNVEVKASAAFKAGGDASAELKSSGTMIVKGAMVQIN